MKDIGALIVLVAAIILSIVILHVIPVKAQEEEGGCVQVDKLDFILPSNTTIPKEELLRTNFENRCLTAKDIGELLNAVNNFYISEGYITTRATFRHCSA